MDKKKAVIHYLYHSGFAVETGDYFLVFDYYPDSSMDERSGIGQGVVSAADFEGKKHPYVFSSHGHGDHFHPSIFDWQKDHPGIRYILSSDIQEKAQIGGIQNSCIYMSPYETIEEEGICVKSYGSTDIGVSFLIEVNGLRLFHAGDLNWWHWADESTREELAEEEEKYKKEIARLPREKMDIAFFPVDPRLGEYYYLGGTYFIETFKPRLFFPMHFAGKHDISRNFAARNQEKQVETAIIQGSGQCFEYWPER